MKNKIIILTLLISFLTVGASAQTTLQTYGCESGTLDSGFSVDYGSTPTCQNNQVYNGNYALELSASGNSQTWYTKNTNYKPNNVQTAFYISSKPSYDASLRVRDSQTNSLDIGYQDSAPSSIWVWGNAYQYDTVTGKWFFIELKNIDWANSNIGEIVINGVTKGTNVNYQSINGIYESGARIGTASQMTLYLDDFTIPEEKVAENPVINNIELNNGQPIKLNQAVNVSSDITDDSTVSLAYAEAYEGDILIANQSMNQNGDIWAANNIFRPDKVNTNYTVNVHARDADGLTDSKNRTTKIFDLTELSLNTEYEGVNITTGDELTDFYNLMYYRYADDVNQYNVSIYYKVNDGIGNETYKIQELTQDMTQTSVLTSINKVNDLVFEDDPQVNSTAWNNFIQDAENSNYITIYVTATAVNSTGAALDARNYPIKSNEIRMNYDVSQRGIFQGALEWFYDNFIDPLGNAVTNLLETIAGAVSGLVNAFLSIIFALAEAIIWLITSLLQVVIDITMYVVNSLINGLQYVMFYHTDVDYQYNNTTYDNMSQVDAPVLELVTGNFTVVEGTTQAERFDSLFGLEGKTLFTSTDSVTIYEYEIGDIERFFSDVNTTEENESTSNVTGKYSGLVQHELIYQAQTPNSQNRFEEVSGSYNTSRFYGIVRYYGDEIYRYEYSDDGVNRSTAYAFDSGGRHIGTGNNLTIASGEFNPSYIMFNETSDTASPLYSGIQDYDDITNLKMKNNDKYGLATVSSGAVLVNAKGEFVADLGDDISNIKDYTFKDNTDMVYVVNGTHAVRWSTATTAVESTTPITNAQDISAPVQNNQVFISRGENGSGFYGVENFELQTNYSLNVADSLIYPAGEAALVKTAQGDALEISAEESKINHEYLTGVSDIALADKGHISIMNKGGFDNSYIYAYYNDAQEVQLVEEDVPDVISLTVDIFKPFDVLGIPYGSIVVINVLLGLTAIVVAVIPDPILEAIETLFSVALRVVNLAVLVVNTVGGALNWAFTEGKRIVKWLIIGYVGVKGLKYYEMYQDDRYSSVHVMNEVVSDVEETFDRIVTITHESFDIIHKTWETFIEILKSIKSTIPFIG